MNPFDFVARMRRIADANDDEWTIWFSADPQTKLWQVEVKESAEGHGIIAGDGPTPESACDAALAMLPAELIAWGYTDAD